MNRQGEVRLPLERDNEKGPARSEYYFTPAETQPKTRPSNSFHSRTNAPIWTRTTMIEPPFWTQDEIATQILVRSDMTHDQASAETTNEHP